jgi:dTMP kinase
MSAPRAGVFIAFEGTEGVGKSTHLERAAEQLRAEGHRVLATAQPGGTALGRSLRAILLGRNEYVPNPLAELFLYLADRAQHVSEVIRPALAAGEIVLVDRYSASTIAYQGYARGLDLDRVTRADQWARGGLDPDLTVWLDCPVRIGLERAGQPDRFHAEAEAFHERVRSGFAALAAASPGWHRIDATRPVAEVYDEVMAALRSRVEKR